MFNRMLFLSLLSWLLTISFIFETICNNSLYSISFLLDAILYFNSVNLIQLIVFLNSHQYYILLRKELLFQQN